MDDDDREILRPVRARFVSGWDEWVDCAQGWWPIIAELDRNISAIAPDYAVQQIKEKFGGLRYYYSIGEAGVDPRIDDLIDAAERVAARAREFCGTPGRARSGGWIETTCDDHANGMA